jgi:hypothetical protein
MVAIVPAVQIAATDIVVSTPTPQKPPPTMESITGTPGTDGSKTFGTYRGQPIPEPHRIWKFDVDLPKIRNPSDPSRDVPTPIVQSIEPGFDNTSQSIFR